jgi:hypothetical protein
VDNIKVCQIHILAVATLLAAASLASAQTPPAPVRQGGGPRVVIEDPLRQQAFEEQRKSFADYQQCVAANERAVKLASLTRDLVQLRDNPQMAQAVLAHDAATRARYPRGYAELMAVGFEEYKRLGGTAGSIGAMRETPSPCAMPAPALPSSRPRASITQSRSMVVPIK